MGNLSTRIQIAFQTGTIVQYCSRLWIQCRSNSKLEKETSFRCRQKSNDCIGRNGKLSDGCDEDIYSDSPVPRNHSLYPVQILFHRLLVRQEHKLRVEGIYLLRRSWYTSSSMHINKSCFFCLPGMFEIVWFFYLPFCYWVNIGVRSLVSGGFSIVQIERYDQTYMSKSGISQYLPEVREIHPKVPGLSTIQLYVHRNPESRKLISGTRKTRE